MTKNSPKPSKEKAPDIDVHSYKFTHVYFILVVFSVVLSDLDIMVI